MLYSWLSCTLHLGRGVTCLIVEGLAYCTHFPDHNVRPWLRKSTPCVLECVFCAFNFCIHTSIQNTLTPKISQCITTNEFVNSVISVFLMFQGIINLSVCLAHQLDLVCVYIISVLRIWCGKFYSVLDTNKFVGKL